MAETNTNTEITEELTISQQFDKLVIEATRQAAQGKTLALAIKGIQKEVAKTAKATIKGKRTRAPRAPLDPDVERKPSALQIPVKISDELCTFLGFEVGTEHSRREVTDTINKYIKTNELQNPENRRFILMSGTPASDSLCKLLRTPDQPVTFFNIQRYLKPHYPPSAKDIKAAAAAAEAATATSTEVVPDAAMVDASSDVSPDTKPAKKVQRRVVRSKA